MTTFKTALLAATALTLMSGAALAQSNQATSNSTGDNNVTSITQTSASGRGHVANSDLTGDRNNVLVIQENPSTSSNGRAAADIDVNGANGGDFNRIEIRQTAFNENPFSNDDKSATVNVFGDGNTVVGTQEFGSAAEPNTLTVSINGDTEGNRNNVDVRQTNNGQNSTTSIWGDSNTVDVDQVAGGSRATIEIDGGTANGGNGGGNFNSLTINQSSGNGQRASLTVFGDSNRGVVNQGGGVSNTATVNVGSASFDSDNNVFTVNQTGNSNDLLASILGDRNELTASQTGDDNDITSSQLGNFNTATVTQTSNGNVATVSQIGDSNSTTITQGGVVAASFKQ